MKHLFLDSNDRLRNGWWIAIFIALMFASRFVYTPASRALQDLGLTQDWLEPLRFGLLLLVTWICVRLRKDKLSSVGFVLNARWARELGIGLAFGIASALLAVAMIWLAGGVRFELDPARSVSILLYGVYVHAFVALFEETLFRGFAFQRFVDGAGPWIAQIVLGLVFATSHWGNPDMDGITLIIATVELFLGAVILGLAYLRTRSLALPIGLHFGWNWLHGYGLGLGVSGVEHAGWLRPLLQDVPTWVNGGRFGPEASVFAIVTDLAAIVLLWKWKGLSPRPSAQNRPGPAPETRAPAAI